MINFVSLNQGLNATSESKFRGMALDIGMTSVSHSVFHSQAEKMLSPRLRAFMVRLTYRYSHNGYPARKGISSEPQHGGRPVSILGLFLAESLGG